MDLTVDTPRKVKVCHTNRPVAGRTLDCFAQQDPVHVDEMRLSLLHFPKTPNKLLGLERSRSSLVQHAELGRLLDTPLLIPGTPLRGNSKRVVDQQFLEFRGRDEEGVLQVETRRIR